MAILHAWRFCPRCASEVEREPGSVRCPACGFVGYANSAPCACALVEDDAGRLLLGRRAVEPDRGLWDIPGSYLEEHEHPLDGLRREQEHELDDVEERLPADHYVLVDDKVRILAAVKAAWGSRVTTVWPRQGHYALDVADVARYPTPDLTIERIGDLVEHHRAGLLAAAGR